jgi:cytochrome c oxidase cbb3-type subunit 2
MLGKNVYIANGCVGCHTQQVRNVDMDKVWGERPGIAADYAGIKRTDFWRNTATLMGTERTGPDLTNIGKRQSSLAWNLLHLYTGRHWTQRQLNST